MIRNSTLAGSMHIYIWSYIGKEKETKMGEVFIHTGDDVEKRVREAIKRCADHAMVARGKVLSDHWNMGRYAEIAGRNCAHAHFDDWLRNQIPEFKNSYTGVNERHELSFDCAKDAIDKFVGSECRSRPSFPFVPEQNKIIDRITKTIKSGTPKEHPIYGSVKSALLNADTGLGKTATGFKAGISGLSMAEETIIVLTPYPTLKPEYMELLCEWSDFKDYRVIAISGKKQEIVQNPKNAKGTIVLVSLAGARHEDDKKEDNNTKQSIRKVVREYGLKIVGFINDEAHTDLYTPLAKKTISSAIKAYCKNNPPWLIALSATAEKDSDYYSDAIFQYAEDARGWGGYFSDIPEVRILSTPALLSSSEYHKKALASGKKDDHWITGGPGDTLRVIDTMISPPQRKLDDFPTEISEQPRFGDEDGKLASYLYFRTIENAVSAYEEAKKRHHKDFDLIHHSELRAISTQDLNDRIKTNRSNGKHTLIFGCGRLLVGSNIPELTELVLMEQAGSPVQLRQYRGRLLRKGGHFVKHLIFATPGACASFQKRMIELEVIKAEKSGSSPEEIMNNYKSRCLSAFDCYGLRDTGFLEVEQDILDFIRQIMSSRSFNRGYVRADEVGLSMAYGKDLTNAIKACRNVSRLKDGDVAQIKITQDTDIEKYSLAKNNKNVPKKSSGKQSNINRLKCAHQAFLSTMYDLTASKKLNGSEDSTQIKDLILEQNIDSWGEKNIDREVISNLLKLMPDAHLLAVVSAMERAIDKQVYPIVNPYARVLSSTPRHTPPDLVRRMIKPINSAFENSEKTFVDPACGTGMILSEVARRLFENGHRWPNVLGRINGFCVNDSYIGSARRNVSYIFKEYGKYSLTDAELDGIIKVENVLEKELNMRFNYCIQNPPYQMRHSAERQTGVSIYPNFVRWAAKHCDTTIALTPSRWFKQKDMLKYKDWLIDPAQGLRYIWHTDDDAIFGNGVSVKGGVSFIVLDKNYRGPTYVNFLEDATDLTLNDARILVTKSKTAESIIKKISGCEPLTSLFVSSGSFKIRSNDSRLIDDPTSTSVKCYVSKLKGSEKHIEKVEVEGNKHFMSWKLVIRSADGKGNDYTRYNFLAAPGEVVSESYCFFPFKTKHEALNYQSYLETSFHSFLMKLKKSTQRISKPVFEFIPVLDFSKSWSDSELNKMFGLTAEEISYINEQVG